MQVENTAETRTVEASAEELAAWEKYKAEAQIKSIPIPYAFVSGGVNVAGVFYLEDLLKIALQREPLSEQSSGCTA